MEEWRDIKGYEGYYQVSNLGRVKSLSRMINGNGGSVFKSKTKILKAGLASTGYYSVRLSMYNNSKTFNIHQLVATEFLNHKPCGFKMVINHINFNKTDNRAENLEIVTNRENTNRKHIKSTSSYLGVSWHKGVGKWQATITHRFNRYHLGYFKCELKASLAYQNKLKELSP